VPGPDPALFFTHTFFVCIYDDIVENKSRHLLCGWAKLERNKIVKNLKFSKKYLAQSVLNVCICFLIGGGGGFAECILWLSFTQQKCKIRECRNFLWLHTQRSICARTKAAALIIGSLSPENLFSAFVGAYLLFTVNEVLVIYVPHDQGDRIWRIFAQWVIVYLGLLFWKLHKQPSNSGHFVPRVRLFIHFDKKCVGLLFCAFFSQTNLVALLATALRSRSYE
jgi:hypothetical protein